MRDAGQIQTNSVRTNRSRQVYFFHLPATDANTIEMPDRQDPPVAVETPRVLTNHPPCEGRRPITSQDIGLRFWWTESQQNSTANETELDAPATRQQALLAASSAHAPFAVRSDSLRGHVRYSTDHIR